MTYSCLQEGLEDSNHRVLVGWGLMGGGVMGVCGLRGVRGFVRFRKFSRVGWRV